MNKLLFVLLAICIIDCVRAFVKRDTGSDDLWKRAEEQLQGITKTIKDQVDMEAVQKQIAAGYAVVQENLKQFLNKNSVEAPKA